MNKYLTKSTSKQKVVISYSYNIFFKIIKTRESLFGENIDDLLR
jgi:hypothetical protein